MRIVCFTGPSKSGKDAAAAALERALAPRKVLRVGLADGLKRAAAELHGFHPSLFFDRESKDYPIAEGRSPRDLLLELGAAVGPALGEDVHSRRIITQARRGSYDFLLVSDLRLLPEYHCLLAADPNMLILNIDRQLSVGAHRTEAEFRRILEIASHTTVPNVGTLESLRLRMTQLGRVLLDGTPA